MSDKEYHIKIKREQLSQKITQLLNENEYSIKDVNYLFEYIQRRLQATKISPLDSSPLECP